MTTIDLRRTDRAPAWLSILAIAWFCLASGTSLAAPALAAPPAQPVPSAPTAAATLPEAEKTYVAIVDKARGEFSRSKSVDARSGVRMALQISIHNFMNEGHVVQDWVGTFMASKKAENGFRSILIEIAPGISISTWDSPYADAPFDTMIKPYAPMAHVIDGLTIGQTVVFSANLIGGVVGSDDEMVMHPHMIGQITRLTGIDTPLIPR